MVSARRAKAAGKDAAGFTAVNVAATVLALGAFNLLVHGVRGWFDGPMNDRPLSAYVVANSLGMLVSFMGLRHYVYRHRKPMGPGGGFVNYAVVNLISFLFPMALLWVSRNLLDQHSVIADNIAGNVVGAGIAMVFRFWAFRRFVFKVSPPIFRREHLGNPHLKEYGDPHHRGRGRVASGLHRGAGPEVGPHEAELVEHQSQQRDADPDHVVRVSRDAGDEG